jgi:hypothetical protein
VLARLVSSAVVATNKDVWHPNGTGFATAGYSIHVQSSDLGASSSRSGGVGGVQSSSNHLGSPTGSGRGAFSSFDR